MREGSRYNKLELFGIFILMRISLLICFLRGFRIYIGVFGREINEEESKIVVLEGMFVGEGGIWVGRRGVS